MPTETLEKDPRVAEGQLRLLIDQAPVAVAMFDTEMRYIAASSRWLGDYRIETPVLGRSHYDVLPEIPERWKEVHRRALAGESMSEAEDRFDRADGSVQWERWAVRPWRDEHGTIGGIIIFSEDVTDRKRADEARDRFISLVQGSQDFIGMCDRDFVPFFLNEAGLRMVGLRDIEEVRRVSVRDFFFPEDQAFIINDFFPRVVEEGCGESEVRFRHFVTGAPIWMRYSVFCLRAASGQVTGYATVSRNITEEKIAGQQLREARRRLQAIMNAAPIGISYSDSPSCENITGNPALFEQFEFNSSRNISASAPDPAAPGRQVHFLRDGHHVGPKDLPLQRAVAEGREIGPMELEVVLPSGKRWFTEASGAPIIGDDGEIIGGVAVTVDVTERVRAREALRVADRRKDEFLATLAHELRNPLAPIRYGLHALRAGKLSGGESARVIAMMDRQADHLVKLVNELLDVARISTGKIVLNKELIEAGSILSHAVESIEPQMRSAGHNLTVSVPPGPLWIEADPVRLTQVVVNLLSNAAKYTDPGGEIEIQLRRDGDEAVVSVKDNGVGVPPEMLVSIFDLFTQLDMGDRRPREGMGVGLGLARQLVELHGGRLEAKSEGLGKGSEFILRMPLGSFGEKEAAPETVRPTRASPGEPRVLVVDDEADVADSLATLLKQLGATARVEYSAPEAVEAIPTFRPRIVLLDIGMPGTDGYELARRIRRLSGGRELFLAAVTGWGQEADRQKASAAGFDCHFVKPLDSAALEQLFEMAGPSGNLHHVDGRDPDERPGSASELL